MARYVLKTVYWVYTRRCTEPNAHMSSSGALTLPRIGVRVGMGGQVHAATEVCSSNSLPCCTYDSVVYQWLIRIPTITTTPHDQPHLGRVLLRSAVDTPRSSAPCTW